MPDPFGRSTRVRAHPGIVLWRRPLHEFPGDQICAAHQPYSARARAGGAVGAGELHRTTRPGRPAGSHRDRRSRAVGSTPASSWSAAAARPGSRCGAGFRGRSCAVASVRYRLEEDQGVTSVDEHGPPATRPCVLPSRSTRRGGRRASRRCARSSVPGRRERAGTGRFPGPGHPARRRCHGGHHPGSQAGVGELADPARSPGRPDVPSGAGGPQIPPVPGSLFRPAPAARRSRPSPAA